jgi:cytochrome c oxidase subunit III
MPKLPLAETATIEGQPFGVGGPQLPAGGPSVAPPGRRGGGEPWEPQKLPLAVYRIAMMVGLAAILMMFAGLISAFIVRGMALGWKPVVLPKILWLSTLLLLGSSAALVRAQRFLNAEEHRSYRTWLIATLGLGVAFVWSQLSAWAMLSAQGIFLSGSPHSSFFYLFSGLHGVHVLGGLTALAWLVWNARRPPNDAYGQRKRAALVGATALYWHFLDGLWVCLFALLLLWR